MTAQVMLVGGGLANCLVALRLQAARPDVSLLLLDSAPRLCGNHTWSFHSTDVPSNVLDWLQPLASHSWSHYDVKFPARERRLSGGYHSLTAEHLHDVVMAQLGSSVRLGCAVREVAADSVTLHDGQVLSAELVIDGRGLAASSHGDPQPGLTLRFQKFLGQQLRLAAPHGLSGPLLMDATVAQEQGYRFVYLLPFSATGLMIEDTYYSDSAAIDREALRRNIADYAAGRGWRVEVIEREEIGVLPIVLDADLARFWPPADGVPRSGLRAGLFHHTTGYSVPEAAALAHDLPAQRHLRSADIAAWIRGRVQRRWRDQRLYRLLNRMLFLAADPASRYRPLQHFYRLPEPVIERFYAGRSTLADAAQILSGAPPVPVGRALRYLLPSSSHA